MTPNHVTYYSSLEREPQIILYMDNYTNDCEYCISTKPGYTSDMKDIPFVTLVYSAEPLTGDVHLPPVEVIYSDSESEAEKKHAEMLDKWNNIEYSKQIEVTDEEVQDWRSCNVFTV